MKIISFITQSQIIRKILKHLGKWEDKVPRAPPIHHEVETADLVYVAIDDGWSENLYEP
jgi:hypothetical protein